MSNENIGNGSNVSRKFAFKTSSTVFKPSLMAACDEVGVALEEWDRHHAATLQAEFGRLGVSSSKAGLLTIGKGCETAREGISHGYKPGGKAAHASIRFYRECTAAEAYMSEFPTAKVGLSDEGASYVMTVASRAKELKEKAKATKANGETVNA